MMGATHSVEWHFFLNIVNYAVSNVGVKMLGIILMKASS